MQNEDCKSHLKSSLTYVTAPGGGGYSIIWVIQVGAAGQGMVFCPRCPKQGI